MSVISKNDFLRVYRDECASIPNQAVRFYITQIGADNLLSIIENDCIAIHTFLDGLRSDNAFKIGQNRPTTTLLIGQGKGNDYSLIKDAFNKTKRRELTGFWASTAACFVAIWLYKRAERLHAAAGGGGNLDLRVNNGVRQAYAALNANILVKTAVSNRRTFFQNNITEMLTRLSSDWDMINTLFFPNLVLKKLVSMSTTGSDYHKQGKQVLILKFKAHTPGVQQQNVGVFNRNVLVIPARVEVKLVYKPSDIELDWRMMGKTADLQARLPALFGGGAGNDRLVNDISLFESMNNAGANPPLPTYHLLPRSPGSGGGAFGSAYGYLEYLKFEPKSPTALSPFQVDLPMNNYASWNYVIEDPSVVSPNRAQHQAEAANFYQILGWYMGIGLILNFGDQHSENLIVQGKRPYLIDCEIIFKNRANELQATMMEYHLKTPNPNKYKNCLLINTVGGIVSSLGTEAAAQVVAGLNNSIAFIRANGGVFTGWLGGTNMNDVYARYTPRSTAIFTTNMWKVHFANIESNVVLGAGLANQAPFNKMLDWDIYRWFKQGGRGFKGQPLFSVNHQTHDWACYLNQDAPVYYRRLNSLDLVNARGAAVAVANPALIQLNDRQLRNTSTGNGVKAYLAFPQANPVPAEMLVLETVNSGINNKDIKITTRANASGIANQALACVVTTNVNDITLTITFASDNGGASVTPTLAQMQAFLMADAQTNVLASLEPAHAVGGAAMPVVANARLWAKHHALQVVGGHYFDTDVFAVGGGAATPIAISTDRVNQLVANTEGASIQSTVSKTGILLQNATTLADVLAQFQAAPPLANGMNTVTNFTF